jgi:ankyrin repeat protein
MLHLAAESDKPDMVELLIKNQGFTLDAVDKEGGATPLMVAVDKGHQGAVEKLLQLGASPSLIDDRGKTPLMRAVANANPAVLKALLSKMTLEQVNVLDKAGDTALHAAIRKGRVEVVKALFERFPSASDRQKLAARTNANEKSPYVRVGTRARRGTARGGRRRMHTQRRAPS